MKRLAISILLLILISAHSAQAITLRELCSWIIQGRSAAVEDQDLLLDQLPRTVDLELPSAVTKKLSSLVSSDLRRALKNTNINFTGYNPGMNFHRAAIGEGIQSLFVAKVVKSLEKKANVCAEVSCPPNTRFIALQDPWQSSYSGDDERFPTGRWQELPGYHALAMPMLKAANALFASFPKREELRAQMQLPGDLKIASLYGIRLDYSSKDFKSILTSLNKIYSTDILIISDSRDRDFYRLEALLPGDVRVRRLSRLTVGELRKAKNERLIVFNDTIGNLPQIQAFSNLAIVRGPVDFLGPLQSGTPVIGINNEEALRTFHRRGYQRLQELAEATGAAIFTTDLSTLTSDDVAQIQKKDFRRPYEIPIDGSRTALELLLSALNAQFLR